MAGLPTQLQAYVVADPQQTWYQKDLTLEESKNFFAKVEEEGRRRELAGEALTPQSKDGYEAFPSVSMGPKPRKRIDQNAIDADTNPVRSRAPGGGGPPKDKPGGKPSAAHLDAERKRLLDESAG